MSCLQDFITFLNVNLTVSSPELTDVDVVQSGTTGTPIFRHIITLFTNAMSNIRNKVYGLIPGDVTSPQPISESLGRPELEDVVCDSNIAESARSPMIIGKRTHR